MSSEKDMPESRETDSSIGSEHQGEPDPEDQQPRSYREVEISAESLQIITQLPLANFVSYVPYDSELQMPDIMRLMKADLSEPYSIYTYRYFIHNWPRLCILACCDERYVGAIVCKLELHHFTTRRGYIAMLAVDKEYRKRKIGSTLVKRTIQQMVTDGCDEVVLETEVTNQAALSLYENLGFVRDKYLHQYYLNGVDAYRLKLWLKDPLAE